MVIQTFKKKIQKGAGLKILVLMGGDSAERDVSLVSGEAVVEALKKAGHRVIPVDTSKSWQVLPNNNIHYLPEGIKTAPPVMQELKPLDSDVVLKHFESQDLKDVDVIFLALHGGKGEDGTIQALLDLTGKPYTGSGMLASALAMNKDMSKKIFEREKIRTPKWILWELSDSSGISELQKEIKKRFGYPVVVKPDNQGSTIGLTILPKNGNLSEAVNLAGEYSHQILIEEFIPGREITVSVLENQALPVIEIVPEHGIYDYECKYTPGMSKYVCPAELSKKQTKEVQDMAVKAFKVLGCEGYARVDFRLGKDGKFYCLEVNTLPGMTKTSLVPKAAQAAGIEFPQLVDKIVKLALNKKKT